MLHISLLKESDAKDLLQFELENRRYFAASVTDRGDDYFSNFQTVMADDIGAQKRGECQYYLARNSSGDIVGRINLRGVEVQANLQTASLGYRVGERFSGKGYATLAVSLICEKAKYELNIHQLKAMVSAQNVGSQRVPEKSGFRVVDGIPTRFVSNGKTVQAIHYIKFV
ncbi:GNAT family N-acetyltransferase [Alicyclobacillus sp. ALC3]|uniref:GNAT family N-acetyltransferase n=1 Tax=Alicyclobacillus sp. ALC3 TaxID=2796143 RepID=UPI0023788E4F|nr:GNAT family N-acetyltransferase [Alicyclobacillus sp. ALC3]WDL97886.1 GNAT family N-acetyltransferase [Alicyclobacillus sp. ALC3]